MPNNFNFDQGDFGSLGSNPDLANPEPLTSRPVSAQGAGQAEDIFASVDKSGPIIYRPPAPSVPDPATQSFVPKSQAVVSNNFGPEKPNNINPLAASGLPPAAAGGSVKYLLIGILTLVVILAIGFSVYFFILKPQFQGITQVESQTVVQEPINPNPEPVATPVEDVASTTPTIDNDLNQVAVSTTTSDLPASSTISTTTSDQVVEDNDGDGLTNYDEINVYHSNYNNVDTDNDGLSDYQEVKIFSTDPNNPDTDGDSYPDGSEVKNGYNPAGPGRLLVK